MDKQNRTATTPVPARRRLIRGAFATPAALTLYSGSAHALPSLTCVARQAQSPIFPAPVTSVAGDTWLRVRLWSLGDSRWIKVQDVTSFAGGNAALVAYAPVDTGGLPGTWVCYTGGGNSPFVSGQVNSTAYPGGPILPGYTLTQNGDYVAVRVNANGQIVGVVGIDGAAGTAVTGSCWTSFRTGP